MADTIAGALERPAEIEKDPAGVVRRWLMELKVADRDEEDWRKEGRDIFTRYKGEKTKKDSFNILWTNTEVLRPSLYNSVPKPDVRRRFRDADPLGKAVAQVLERSLVYSVDSYDFDGVVKATVLDALLPGRGVDWVRYEPTIAKIEGQEQVTHEVVGCDHVQWDDFRRGPGKTWKECPWMGRRHRMTRDELIEKFGQQIGKAIHLDDTANEEVKSLNDAERETFKTAEVWEFWDKDQRKVLFINASYKQGPCKVEQDPLNLEGFFPCPEPLRMVEDSTSLVPIPLYRLYKEQAEELDRLSRRINKVVSALKVRGIYDATMKELSELMKGDDNDLIPIKDASKFTAVAQGGLEKAIWMMPVESAAKVLRELYEARDSAKMVIYEIMGISDILRGSTEASETATAQQIKANWGSLRLKRMQREVQRYIRDLLRLKAEIIGEKFQPETLKAMTGLKFPTQEDKMIAQAKAAQASATGQQVPQELQQVLMQPSWEEILQVLRSDQMRGYRVDIETDSTVAASIEGDMEGLRDVLTGIVEFIQGIGPAVEAGVVPIEAVKAILLTISRRSKFGTEVEDALDQIQPPRPPQPEAPDQAAIIKAQTDEKVAPIKAQAEQARAQADIVGSKAAIIAATEKTRQAAIQAASPQPIVQRVANG